MRFGSRTWFARSSAATLTWRRPAIDVSVSPGRIVYRAPAYAAPLSVPTPARATTAVTARKRRNRFRRGAMREPIDGLPSDLNGARCRGRLPGCWSAPRCRLGQAPRRGPPFGVEPFEPVGPVVHVGHQRGDGAVARLLGDQPVHLLAHGAVGGVALGAGPQLEEVHRLARVELHHEAHLEGERDGVR